AGPARGAGGDLSQPQRRCSGARAAGLVAGPRDRYGGGRRRAGRHPGAPRSHPPHPGARREARPVVNPFDLPGPQFLVFYWVLLIAGLGTLWWWRWRTDVGGAPERMCGDPYQLAFLRDGHPEVVRV